MEQKLILTDVSILFQLQIFFVYSSGDYSILKQYYVYDVGDFIADIGGYMVRDSTKKLRELFFSRQINFQGLCLGASLLTFYDLTVTLLSKLHKKCLSRDQEVVSQEDRQE